MDLPSLVILFMLADLAVPLVEKPWMPFPFAFVTSNPVKSLTQKALLLVARNGQSVIQISLELFFFFTFPLFSSFSF